MLVVLEGLVMCFWLLLICVVGIADGPVGLVVFYEQDVQDRVVELGLTTAERIKRTSLVSGIAMFVPVLTFVPAVVYLVNGAEGFWSAFVQMTAIYLIMNLFDRFFIDWWWVFRLNAAPFHVMPHQPRKRPSTSSNDAWACFGISCENASSGHFRRLFGCR